MSQWEHARWLPNLNWLEILSGVPGYYLYDLTKTDDVVSIVMELSVNRLLLNCQDSRLYSSRENNLKCIVQEFFQWKLKPCNLYSQTEWENTANAATIIVYSRHTEIGQNNAWAIDDQYNSLSDYKKLASP